MTVGRSFGRLRRNTESAAQSTSYCMVGDEQKQRKKGKRRAVANCGAPEWYLEKITTKWFTSSEGPFILKGISSSSNDDGRRRRLLLAEKVLFSLHHHHHITPPTASSFSTTTPILFHPSGMDRERSNVLLLLLLPRLHEEYNLYTNPRRPPFTMTSQPISDLIGLVRQRNILKGMACSAV